MAAWQFDVKFIRAGHLALATDSELLEASRLSQADYSVAQGYLDYIALPTENITEGWLVYGDTKGNRIDLLVSDDGTVEISARIDAVDDSDVFCNLVCLLATDLGCQLWAFELNRILDPTKDVLVTALMSSDAWKYALDPRAFLRGKS